MTELSSNTSASLASNVGEKRGYWSRVGRDGRKLGKWFVAPTVALLIFIVIFPLLMQLYLSFTWWTPLDGVPWYQAYESFNWGENYLILAYDPAFWAALWRTAMIMLVAVPAQFFLGLGLAYLFIDKFPGRKVFYSIVLTPMMVVPAVVGLMFFLLFQGTGPVNDSLGLPASFSWLTDPNRALISVIIADTWQWTPLMFLILLAGMLGVPSDQLLAARLLGGSNWQNFYKIILPRMKSVIAIAIVLRLVECFKIFDLIFIMTSGGPGVATETISLFLYKKTFADLDWAYVGAVGLAVLIVLSLIAAFGLSRVAKNKG
ncbi:carbohydrate ABC transporter permease [Cognatishimia maritima]|uniref:Carbohydrate ABC transporter membrane protein 1, CUT1 family n=1 Tax=Cognatishimia maritima TaxID=870908 RepID=A0A1M5QAI9_9RHOB|nr:sugar ABC transporter permease [Cognatishimia maritima]SHH10749.1 carbohydrate ABC transporter membrane protein 1, CUT1 family [Cognatishimia maritima]